MASRSGISRCWRPAARSIIRELLAPFGLDASDPAFWQIGLAVIERMIDELEAHGVSARPRRNAQSC